jgi:hypothetical protein
MSEARQGHRYSWRGHDVIALSSGKSVQVALLLPGAHWIGIKFVAMARHLTPLPMRYFHGQVPS